MLFILLPLPKLFFLPECLQNFFRGDGKLVETNTDRVVYGVLQCGDDTDKAALSNKFRTETSRPLEAVYEFGINFGDICRRRDLIIKKTNVHDSALFIMTKMFHQGPSITLR